MENKANGSIMLRGRKRCAETAQYYGKKRKRLSVMAAGCFLLAAVTPLSAEEQQPIEQYLTMDLSQLMEVTITSVSKKPQSLADTAAAVYVITQEEIRRTGVTSIPEALALAPGVHVAQISSSKWSVSARGFAGYTSNKLLVLLDGRSVYSPAFSGTLWDVPHTLLEDIDRIEVIRGPGGTIWGANAVNGVINIITKSAHDTTGGLVRGGVGTHEEIQAGARYGMKFSDSISGRLYITKNDRDSFTLTDSGLDAGDSWENHRAGFRVDGSTETKSEWTVQGDVYKNSGDQLLFPHWVPGPPFLTTKMTDLDNSGANLTGKYEKQIGDDQKLSAQIYYDYNSRDEDVYDFEFRTFDVDLNYDINLTEKNTLSLGVGYRNIDASFERSFQLELPDRNYNLYSAFVQDEFRMLDDSLIATLGVKWEHNTFTGNEFQPSAKLLWKVQENQSLWISFARAVRTPSLVEDSGRLVFASFPTPFGIGTTSIFGSKDFESEIVFAYEAGYRWQSSSNLSFDLALFYNNYDDLYGLDVQDPFMTRLSIANTTEADSYGAELSVKWQAKDWLSFQFTYAYLGFDSDQDLSLGASTFRTSVFDGTSPNHQVGLRFSADLTRTLQLNSWLRYQDETIGRSSSDFFLQEIPIDDYLALDLNLIWRPKENLEIMIAGKNLLEDEELQYVAEAITAPTDIERSVFAKITYRF